MISNDTAVFHDSTILDFRSEGDAAFLRLEDVQIDGRKVEVDITVSGWLSGIQDHLPAAGGGSLMESPEGDVLTLKFTDRSLYILVEWMNYAKKTKQTRVYDIVAEKVTVAPR